MAIGPHQGKELELMLAGHKSLAAFGDIIPEDGIIDEIIIPEKAFAPYVQTGQVIRFEKIIINRLNDPIKNVCFTLPNEEWRALAYLWIREQTYTKKMPDDAASDTMIGRLLGYSEADIAEFNAQFI